MSGTTITHQARTPATAERAADTRHAPSTQASSVTLSRAARELGLKRSELDIAVRLGRVRTAPDGAGSGRRVPRPEIERLRGEDGFPQSLRESVSVVGTAQGAALIGVAKARFTRLARLGVLVPVKFYLNRYRAVVWLYLADELRRFAADERNAPLLKGRLSEAQRSRLEAGLDLRPRNWRGRHLGFMLRQAHDPWTRAAAVASLLDPLRISRLVRDPYERSRLNRFRPAPREHGWPGSPVTRITAAILTADDPEEVEWLAAELARELAAAREQRPAPKPAARRPGHRPACSGPAPRPTASHPVPRRRPPGRPAPGRTRGPLSWFRPRSS
ncbi:hypothetical protein SUDANB58_00612 [Streptomyces sp. enrichment culture]|uniref:DUF6397 family protein n=1 Tax=Streptomyces sp. enrichment culture TaxID=1795815 RepID=UPI003F5501FA